MNLFSKSVLVVIVAAVLSMSFVASSCVTGPQTDEQADTMVAEMSPEEVSRGVALVNRVDNAKSAIAAAVSSGVLESSAEMEALVAERDAAVEAFSAYYREQVGDAGFEAGSWIGKWAGGLIPWLPPGVSAMLVGALGAKLGTSVATPRGMSLLMAALRRLGKSLPGGQGDLQLAEAVRLWLASMGLQHSTASSKKAADDELKSAA